ncbi:MAG: RNA pseudouridine synthase [Defluviitaleaceae bacterium]|nr:RNA pseudouridine synthase [Defluviitaleaceae bacterium]
MVEKLETLFEDNDIMVVRKPQGMPCQPDKTGAADIASMLAENNGGYIGPVHRLDRPVGGVMVFAKNSNACAKLSKQVAEGGFRKAYLAVVEAASVAPVNAELRDFLVKNERLNMSSVADGAHIHGAKEAVLHYALAESCEDTDGMPLHLLKINLVTGRHHQIRVQLAHAGLPIWGDTKYGIKKRYRTPPNLALWAFNLSFCHPTNGRELNFESRPDDIFPFNRFL